MSYSSSLIDITYPLVLDTSVLINLHACNHGERILMAIPNDIVLSEVVARELEHETSRRNGEHRFLHNLLTGGIVTLATMADAEYEIFHELTSTALSLDDGEAATIAIGAARNLMPVIDERRGRNCAGTRLKGRTPGWSVDLFLHPATKAVLGDQPAVEALYLALRDGRMRIPSDSAESVIALIGEQRAHDCTCLPGYKERCVGARNYTTEEGTAGFENQKISE